MNTVDQKIPTPWSWEKVTSGTWASPVPFPRTMTDGGAWLTAPILDFSHPVLASVYHPPTPAVLTLRVGADWAPYRSHRMLPITHAAAVLIESLDLIRSLQRGGIYHGDFHAGALFLHSAGRACWAPPRPMEAASKAATGDIADLARTFLDLLDEQHPSSASSWRLSGNLGREWQLLLIAMGVLEGHSAIEPDAAFRLARFVAYYMWPYATSLRMCIQDGIVTTKEAEEMDRLRSVLGMSTDTARAIENLIVEGEFCWKSVKEVADSCTRTCERR